MNTKKLDGIAKEILIVLKTVVVRQSPRIWWRYKLNIVANHKQKNSHDLQTLLYVLFSPELDTFSYDIRNRGSIEHEICKLFSSETNSVEFSKEFDKNKFSKKTLLNRIFHLPHSKFAPQRGRHFITFVATRTFKPILVIESGIKHGLGSHVISAALKRNREEDSKLDCKYIGIDTYSKAGHLTRFNSITSKEFGDSLNYLNKRVETREKVSKLFFISDSIPGEQINHELELASQITEAELLFAYNQNWVSSIKTPSGFRLSGVATITEDAVHPFYPGRTLEFVRFARIARSRE
jgi:hypothetical protein